MRKSKSFIVIAVLFLAIGFAAVATNLFINGSVLVGTNEENFDVIFTRSVIDGVNRSTETISTDGKSITFNTRDLSKVGDKSTLDFEVTNKSTQYDANVTIECVGGVGENNYYTVSKDFPALVSAQTRENGKVEVTLNKVTVTPITENFTCTLSVNAIERIDKPVELKACNVVSGDGSQVGDKINCGSESFYVIKNDGTNIRMLAEYNLLVGNEANWDGSKWNVAPLTSPTGLQDSKALGAIYKDGNFNNEYTRYGTIEYSSVDTTYNGSEVEMHVLNYKDKLVSMGVTVVDATLITKEELNELGMFSGNNNILGKEWLYQTSYWTRSSVNTTILYRVSTMGALATSGSIPCTSNSFYGVRPVISIPVDQI